MPSLSLLKNTDFTEAFVKFQDPVIPVVVKEVTSDHFIVKRFFHSVVL